MQILVSLFVAILTGFNCFEGEFNVIILLEPMSLRLRTYMSIILKSYNALNFHHFNRISSNVHRNQNVTMYSLELYCSLLVFTLRVQQKVHIRES